MKILIDNGHGENTPGKCSPDAALYEWSWTREIARCVVNSLRKQGYDAELLVREDSDVSLRERVKRVNAVCAEEGSKNVLCVSIHCNAAGRDGRWYNASGWSVYVGKNASVASKTLARTLYDVADSLDMQGNRSVPKGRYWVQDLAICRDTLCPAVLTENMFMDNREDVKFLLSREGKQKCVDVHVDGIIRYLEVKS